MHKGNAGATEKPCVFIGFFEEFSFRGVFFLRFGQRIVEITMKKMG